MPTENVRIAGIDYGTVSRTNTRLVYCSLTAFGQTGPLAQVPAHDPVIQAMAGTLPRDERGVPVTSGASLAALAGSLTALSAVLMALLHARETGEGDFVDISLYDAALCAQPHLTARALNPAASGPVDSAYGSNAIALLAAYQTRDAQWLCGNYGRCERLAELCTEEYWPRHNTEGVCTLLCTCPDADPRAGALAE